MRAPPFFADFEGLFPEDGRRTVLAHGLIPDIRKPPKPQQKKVKKTRYEKKHQKDFAMVQRVIAKVRSEREDEAQTEAKRQTESRWLDNGWMGKVDKFT